MTQTKSLHNAIRKLPFFCELNDQEKVGLLQKLPFFSELCDQEKGELLKVASFRHCEDGNTLFLYSDILTHLYWICTGAVQMFCNTPDGHELPGSVRIAGNVLYEPKAPQDQSINARAIQDTMLLAIPLFWIDEHLASWAELAS